MEARNYKNMTRKEALKEIIAIMDAVADSKLPNQKALEGINNVLSQLDSKLD